MVGLTMDTLRRAPLTPLRTAWVPITQVPGSVLSFPNQMDSAERECEIFEVEGTWTNDIITPQNHFKGNYGLLLGCCTFPSFFKVMRLCSE